MDLPAHPLSPVTIAKRTARGRLSMAAPAQHPCSVPSHSENSPAFVQAGPEGGSGSPVHSSTFNTQQLGTLGSPGYKRVTRLSSEDKNHMKPSRRC